MANDFELLVLFTSTPGFHVDVKMAEMMKDTNPKLKVAFVGPPVTVEPEKSLRTSPAIDFVVRREFDYQIADYARGTPVEDLPGVSFRKNGHIVNNPERRPIENLDELPWVTKVYKRDLDVRRYNVPFLLNPYISLYTSRGCPAMCTFCLWPQTHSGHRWRLRSTDDIAREVAYAKEIFRACQGNLLRRRHLQLSEGAHHRVVQEAEAAEFHLVCTSRVTTDYDTLKAMKDSGCRLLIVGYESGDQQILKNIKKGATIDMALRFTDNCKKLGLMVHGDFIIGLPGETRESIRKTIDFAKRLDTSKPSRFRSPIPTPAPNSTTTSRSQQSHHHRRHDR
jgi:radical SAM superfamily enzyme YgiQ (UPF0313 family)